MNSVESEKTNRPDSGTSSTDPTPVGGATSAGAGTLGQTPAGKSRADNVDQTEVGTEEGTERRVKEDKPPLADHDSSVLDLAFAMDCTSSMGPYIEMAQSSIRHIVEEIVSTEASDIRLALVEYRDHPPQDSTFVTRVLDFTSSVKEMKTRLDDSAAVGGGDVPEAVADGLYKVSTLSWRPEATKICVLISDAPPHGLGADPCDGFPNGCPDNLDPLEITRNLAQKSITLYVVGCEPAVVLYRDFFTSLAHTTGGQYVPLTNASLLAKVIIGGAQEEVTLERLMRDAHADLQEHVQASGGWDHYKENVEEVAERVMCMLNSRRYHNVQLRRTGTALPKVSAKFSSFRTISDVRKEYKQRGVTTHASRFNKHYHRLRAMMDPTTNSFPDESPSAHSDYTETDDVSSENAESVDSLTEGYEIVSTDQVNIDQTKRMLSKLMNRDS